MHLAQSIAAMTKGKTLEQTAGGAELNDLQLFGYVDVVFVLVLLIDVSKMRTQF
jgi:hypothetical protein